MAALNVVETSDDRMRRARRRGGTGAVLAILPLYAKSTLSTETPNIEAEITAIPEPLDMLAIEGAIVSIDAMGTQEQIASHMVDHVHRSMEIALEAPVRAH
jgi:hypothetical protein